MDDRVTPGPVPGRLGSASAWESISLRSGGWGWPAGTLLRVRVVWWPRARRRHGQELLDRRAKTVGPAGMSMSSGIGHQTLLDPQKSWCRRVRVTPGGASGDGRGGTDRQTIRLGGVLAKEAHDGRQKGKTYNSGYSHVVTHRTTSPPVRSLSSGERTGSSVLCDLWSYVPVRQNAKYIYLDRGQHSSPALVRFPPSP